MRLALLADIHGNPIALDAVLADVAAQGGVEAFWILGDVAALGYDPVAVIERLVALPNVRFVRGNTDRYIVSGDRPPPTHEEARANLQLLPVLIEVAESCAWTQGCLAATGWLQWMADLPLEARMTLPDGTRLLGVHASPGNDDDPGIHPRLSDSDLHSLVATCGAELVCVGHTHLPLDRSVGNVRVVNVGSVSNPTTSDLRASYVLLNATPAGYDLQFRRVAYDVGAVIAAIERSRHPGRDYLLRFMRGQVRSPWSLA